MRLKIVATVAAIAALVAAPAAFAGSLPVVTCKNSGALTQLQNHWTTTVKVNYKAGNTIYVNFIPRGGVINQPYMKSFRVTDVATNQGLNWTACPGVVTK